MAVLFPFWEYRPGLTALSLLAVPVLVALHAPADLRHRWPDVVLRLFHRPPLEVTMGFGAVLGFLVLFTVDWIVAGAGAWLLARAITGLASTRCRWRSSPIALAYVAGMVAFFIPSGIGVREAVLTASLSRAAARRGGARLGAVPAPVGDRHGARCSSASSSAWSCCLRRRSEA